VGRGETRPYPLLAGREESCSRRLPLSELAGRVAEESFRSPEDLAAFPEERIEMFVLNYADVP
jgi:hypothetical protein